jgi:ABC-type dipeptide/oligopeptide/nickel transport system ATPase subunit
MGLLPEYAAVSGSVTLGGRELLGLGDEEMSGIRGREIGMIFQDPMSSLTPIFTVGSQIVEPLPYPDAVFVSRCPLHVTLAEAERSRCRGERPTLTGPDRSDHRNACHYR